MSDRRPAVAVVSCVGECHRNFFGPRGSEQRGRGEPQVRWMDSTVKEKADAATKAPGGEPKQELSDGQRCRRS